MADTFKTADDKKFGDKKVTSNHPKPEKNKSFAQGQKEAMKRRMAKAY